MIRDDMRRAGMERQIQTGFVLTGGGAQLNGFGEFAEHVFQLPVRLGEPRGIMDMPESVAKPDYATVVGLVLHAAKTRRTNSQKANTLVSKLKAMFAGA
jgi:cell division protein FtsA